MASKGTIYIRKDLGIGFIPIPKNGSSTIRSFFFNWDPKKFGGCFNFIESPNVLKGLRVIAIVSDPEIRFARGITEVLSREETYRQIQTPEFRECNDFGCKVNSLLNQIDSIGFYDPHIKPQSHFITDENGNMLDGIELWLLKDLTKKIREIDTKYNGKKEWSKGDNKNQYLNSIKNSPEIKQRLKSFYGDDFKLYHLLLKNEI